MFLTIVTFVIVLSLLVFVHELGHFWVARRMGVKAEEFGFGFPPRAIGVYKSLSGKWRVVIGKREVDDAADTIYSVNWILLGGFVKIKGEEGEDGDDSDSLGSKKIWQRAAVMSAGVIMNIVLAGVLIIFGYMIGMPQSLQGLDESARVSDPKVQVVQVMPDTPAAAAELKVGDIIASIEGEGMESAEEIQNYTDEGAGQELAYTIERGGETITKIITPEEMEGSERAGIGIAIAETGIVRYPFFIAIWEGIKTTVFLTFAILVAFYELIKGLVMSDPVAADVAGPVGIAALTGQMARMGFAYVVQFTALLSINLAIINALPIPALDGGKLLFLAIEKVKGRPVKAELENTIHYIGFALLMTLVLVITFRDIAKYSETVGGLVERIF
jgi:regulator of sigma E protease